MQRCLAFEQTETLVNRFRNVKTSDQGGSKVAAGGYTFQKVLRTHGNQAVPFVVSQSTWTDDRPIQIYVQQVSLRKSLSLVVVSDSRIVVFVSIDCVEHNLAFHDLHLCRHHRPYHSDMVDKHRFVLIRAIAGSDGEIDRIASQDCVIDWIFQIGQNIS